MLKQEVMKTEFLRIQIERETGVQLLFHANDGTKHIFKHLFN
jgi:hypothetical protein